jgi:hypothetical protein
MDEVWRLTQTPDLHQRWDLRFTSIAYLDSRGSGFPSPRFAGIIRQGSERHPELEELRP